MQNEVRIAKLIGIFLRFMLAIPDIAIYSEQKPDIEWVNPETTLSRESTG
jgi:hypothetical protein